MSINNVFNQIEDGIVSILGESIKNPIHAQLGNPTTGETEVSLDESGIAGMFWIHGISGVNTEISGDQSDSDDKQFILQALLKPNKIPPGQLIYGTPILVKRVAGIYEIDDLDGTRATEYLYGLKERVQRSVDVSQIDYGLVRPSDPLSFKVLVSGARYIFNSVAYNVPTLQTSDLSSNIPGTAGKAKAILILLDATTNTLSYVVSAQFDNNSDHSAVFSNYPSAVSDSLFACGWVKVYNGMTAIDIVDIYPGQEFFNKKVQTPFPSDEVYERIWIGGF